MPIWVVPFLLGLGLGLLSSVILYYLIAYGLAEALKQLFNTHQELDD